MRGVDAIEIYGGGLYRGMRRYLATFNDKLQDYLIWLNVSRPHYPRGLRSHMQLLAEEFECNHYCPAK